jgi:rod shape determining protein RodA
VHWLSFQVLRRLDWRLIVTLLGFMAVSLLTVSATTAQYYEAEESFWTPFVVHQLEWFCIGWAAFVLGAAFDYQKLREWTWPLYGVMLLLLAGLFLVDPIQNVHRWYRIPGLGATFQPSEYAKLIVVMTLSWFMERKSEWMQEPRTVFQALCIVGIPFFLILRQPDLGTALVLFPITLVLFYLGGVKRIVVRTMAWIGLLGLCCSALVFLEVIPHETLRPYATKVLKDYQFERLNPNTYHQRAATTAVALGGVTGVGWNRSEYTGRGWLPAAHTDSIFPAFAEEFGLVGVVILVSLCYTLVSLGFQVTALARDEFGRMLAAGITVYLAMHMIVNMGMMLGCLPITGVPLILVSYGGSSVLSTMAALGLLQSVYVRRFLFRAPG